MSRFRNRQTYLDVFPEYKTALVGTEFRMPKQRDISYSPLGGSAPPTGHSPLERLSAVKEQFGQSPLERLSAQTGQSPIQPLTFTKPKTYPGLSAQTGHSPGQQVSMTGYVTKNKYDPSLHEDIPKSQLELPLQLALKMTYPEQIGKYREEVERYGYFVDPLTDEEHSVLYNPSKKSVIFGVRGTNVMNTQDILTDVESAFIDIKKFNRYKKAEEKYKQIKSKFDNIPIIHASHSLGGLISSVLAEPEDFVYSYNRPYFSYPIKKNEVAISTETDPLLLTRWKNQGNQPVIIPRTYYEKAKDYMAIRKTKVNPEYEEKPYDIPQKYKSDLPDVAYQNILTGAFPIINFAQSMYKKYVQQPEVYRQQLIANLQQQATSASERMERVASRLSPRLSPRSTSPRTMMRLQQAISRPLTAIEQNVLNPSIMDTTQRAIRQVMRNPANAFYDVLGHPLLGYAATQYAGGYLSRKASNSHAIENLPLNVRINTKYIQEPDYGI